MTAAAIATVSIAVALSASRAGMAALLVTGMFFLFYRFRIKTKSRIIIAAMAGLMVLPGLYLIKKDSADGRLLIWRCSLEMIRDKPLLGHGYNGFNAHYMDYQASYFETDPNSNYAMLADNVNRPFNEYIKLGVNYGLTGLFIFLLLILLFWNIYRHNLRKTLITHIACLCLLSIGVFALFSYPLTYPFVWVMLAGSLLILINGRYPVILCRKKKTGMFLLLILTAILYGSAYRRMAAEIKWCGIAHKSLLGQTEKMLPEYARLYPELQSNELFLYNYAAELNVAEHYEKSLQIACECERLWADYDLQMLLADNYEKLQRYKEAEQHYQKAAAMCPVKFRPLYKLFQLYEITEEKEKMQKMAQVISEKPIKILSPTVKQIKDQVKQKIPAGSKTTKRAKDFTQLYTHPKDSLKRKAAEFLLEHISAHYSDENSILKEIEKKYEKIKKKNYVESYETFSSVLESIPGHSFISVEEIPDERLVSSRFIIDQIDQAFKVWKNKPWSEEIDFETFCEYVLPYRVMNEPLGFDRRFFQRKYGALVNKEKDIHAAFDSIVKKYPVGYHRLMDEHFPYLMNINLSYKIGIGNCVQQAVTQAMILRSAGIPATVDYVPHWGNYPGRHFAVKRIDKKNTNKNTFDLSLSEHSFTIPEDSLPPGISAIQYRKTVPKVYRMTWSVQPERLLLKAGNKVERTGLFRNLYEKDVTDEYTDCSTVTLSVSDSIDNIVYLCVFERDRRIPVCASPVNNGKAVFKKVGRKVVYLPVYFKEDPLGKNLIPAGAPFYFTAEGKLVSFSGKGQKKQKAKLYSKYPLCSYTAFHAYEMKGGKFQGADSADFSDAETLFTIDYYPFYTQEIAITSNKIFRYFRYLPPPGVLYGLAELQFFTQNEDKKPEPIPGIYFEQYKSKTSNFNYLNDNNLDTYCRGVPVQDSWIGYDTGENNRNRLSKIVFAPQNDGNCIVPGSVYELCYWDKDAWHSLGEKQATTHYLSYDNLPQNALFWLKCHTKGKEERIFTYEKGKQVWW